MSLLDVCMQCRMARKAKGITIAELGAMCGRSASAISRFEHGKYNDYVFAEYEEFILNDYEKELARRCKP